MLLGTDVLKLVSWLKKENNALMVVTRSQSSRQPNSEVAVEDSGTAAISNGEGVAVESVTTESRAEADPLSEETFSTEANVLSGQYNFEDDVFVGGEKDKGPKETRPEKRKRRYEHARAKRAQEGDLDFNLTKEELHKLQEEDPLIQDLRKSRPNQVVERDGLWYSLWRKKHPLDKTTFITTKGLYQFKMMPFELCGIPATFQRMMDEVICGMSQFASAYLDDLIVLSATWKI